MSSQAWLGLATPVALAAGIRNQQMRRWGDPADGEIGDSSEGVAAAEGRGGAARRADNRVPQVRQDLLGRDACFKTLPVVQCPLLRGSPDLSQVADAGIVLRSGACVDPVGNGDRGEQTDQGNHDHYFRQGEPLDSQSSVFHSNSAFLSCGVDLAAGGLI